MFSDEKVMKKGFCVLAVPDAVCECSSCLPHVAGGAVGGVAIGTIVTIIATVIFFKFRRAHPGTSFCLLNYSFLLIYVYDNIYF